MITNEGWMPDVERAVSGAYSIGNTPTAIVNHVMQGYQSTMVTWANERPLKTPVSAHFTIGRNGNIIQHVSIKNSAWHAGKLDSVTPPWRLYRPSTNVNGYTIGIEHEGFSKLNTYGYDYIYDVLHPWPEAMVLASVKVHLWVCQETGIVPSIDTIIRHADIAPLSRVDDPGSAWPRDRIMAALVPAKLGMLDAVYAVYGILGRRVVNLPPEGEFNRAILYWPKA